MPLRGGFPTDAVAWPDALERAPRLLRFTGWALLAFATAYLVAACSARAPGRQLQQITAARRAAVSRRGGVQY